MDCIQIEYVRTDNAGKEWYKVIITSPTVPDNMEFDGSSVDHMPNGTGIAAGSVLLTPSANYVAYVDGTFGGGGGATVTLHNGAEGTITGKFAKDGETTIEEFEVPSGETLEKSLPIGSYVVPYWDELNNIDCYGDGDYETESWGVDLVYKVTGDCSFTFETTI